MMQMFFKCYFIKECQQIDCPDKYVVALNITAWPIKSFQFKLQNSHLKEENFPIIFIKNKLARIKVAQGQGQRALSRSRSRAFNLTFLYKK
jgi:hypothetical protein